MTTVHSYQPPPIVGPVHPDMIACLLDAWHETMGLPPEAAAGLVVRIAGMSRIRRWLGCAPIHDRMSDSWPWLALMIYARGMRG